MRGYVYYLFVARHRWGYGLHSPFMFWFYKRILSPGCRRELSRVRARVRSLLKDQREVVCERVYGAGSTRLSGEREKLASIVRHSSVSYKYGKVLYALAREFTPGVILELGTSVGISTMYLCEGAPGALLYTVEGCREKLDVCRENARLLGDDNVHTLEGSFEDVLPGFLSRTGQLDFVFIDGNHRKDSTIDHFEKLVDHLHSNSVVVIDDIHWSKEMSRAWHTITNHSRVKVSIDLYHMGVLFFRRELSRERFVLAY